MNKFRYFFLSLFICSSLFAEQSKVQKIKNKSAQIVKWVKNHKAIVGSAVALYVSGFAILKIRERQDNFTSVVRAPTFGLMWPIWAFDEIILNKIAPFKNHEKVVYPDYKYSYDDKF